MKVTPTAIPEVLVIEPRVFGDERGLFFECFNERVFLERAGISARFVQDNHSFSVKNTVRGLHYQVVQPQAKLVRVTRGEVFDVVVDIRRGSPNFGRWVGIHLSESNRQMVWIPEGFAHGFSVLSDGADFIYKTSDYWAQQHERTILWNDPDLGIDWQIRGAPVLAPKDKMGMRLADIERQD